MFLLSTTHNPDMTPIKRRHESRNEKKLTDTVQFKAQCLLDYNKFKTGVDRSDQMASYYPFNRKTLKRWKKLFFHVLMFEVINAHILFKITTKKDIRLEDFLKNLIQQMVDKIGTLLKFRN